MKFVIGKKINMSQIWRGDEVAAVTRIQAGPCRVVQIKDETKDGYAAVQLGYGERKEKNIRKPQIGHMAKCGKEKPGVKTNFRYLREFRITDGEKGLRVGDKIGAATFTAGDKVMATGSSRGKGFQGVVKRHKFHGHPQTHGTKDQVRMSGSVGAKGPAHVFKGTRMGGRMGGGRVTVKNLEIVEVDEINNILSIRGAVPGAQNGLILISGEGELKVSAEEARNEDIQGRQGDVKEMAGKEGEAAAENAKEKKTGETPASAEPDEDKKETVKEAPVASAKKTAPVDATAGKAPAAEEKKETSEDVEKEVVEAKKRVDEKTGAAGSK